MEEPTHSLRVRLIPIQSGYAVSVDGLRQLILRDGYEGPLELAVRELLAREMGVPADALNVDVRHELMDAYRDPPIFTWGVAILGVVALGAAALGLALLNPILTAIGSTAAFGLLAVRLGFLRGKLPRIE